LTERTICVVTGARAEYGLLYWLLKEIAADPDLTLRLVVTGMHLAPRFGLTWRAIEDDGFKIDEKVDIDLGDDSARGVARSLGLGTIGMAQAFERLKPDIVVVHGDRFEVLAAAQAALLARLPVAHIRGGELTEGALDDAMRHAITKMAHLHFTASEAYSKRVIQLGEDPDRVFTVGALGLEAISATPPMSRDELEDSLGFPLGETTFLVTYHPATLGLVEPAQAVDELIAALDRFPDANIVFTGVNADPGHDAIAKRIHDYAAHRPGPTHYVESLGQPRYLALMGVSAVVIGNSSSGIVEAPALRVPTVNIGERQKGRLRAASVIDCQETRDAIQGAIEKALEPGFRARLAETVSPYGDGDAAGKIKAVLKKTDLQDIVVKRFVDLPPAA
jgi:UDP-hydrolysing UDP-N-acetyl-D-glucosamine 2-epimerase